MSRLSAFGITLDVPAGWEARAFRHTGGEPTIHLASFPLPRTDGEFGTRTTARMRDGGLFLTLTEYQVGDGDLRHGIFAHGVPQRLDATMLDERTMLRAMPGQRGLQRFFSASGRAFCLYVVAGRNGEHRLDAASAILTSLVIEAR